jgi:hypothetical protein
MSDERAEQWLAEMEQSGRWTPTGIEMLREKIERYGLDWVVANESNIRRFAQTATNSAMALHAFGLLSDEEIEAEVERCVASWKPISGRPP